MSKIKSILGYAFCVLALSSCQSQEPLEKTSESESGENGVDPIGGISSL